MPRSVFIFNTHDLPHRAGEMREYELNLRISEPLGLELLAVNAGEVIEVDLRVQAVEEGVLATGSVIATASGECTRCLKPITWPIDEDFTELFYYQVHGNRQPKKSFNSKSMDSEDIDSTEDDLRFMDGDDIDLEPVIRDAIILNLDVNPLCQEDCPGIEATQGKNWSYLPSDQIQSPQDPRWSALKDFPLKN